MIPTTLNAIRFIQPDDDELGGLCILLTPGANLNYGDAVYISAAMTVTKVATAATYAAFAGFVVGGDLTYNSYLLTKPTTGTIQVATSGKSVLVQISGIAHCITIATPAAGSLVMASGVTAGNVAAGTTAGQVLGTLLELGVAGNLKKILINHR